MTNTNAHFDNAIALQAGIGDHTKTAKDSKAALDDAAFVQMVNFVTGNVDGNHDKNGNRIPTIKGNTKAAALSSVIVFRSVTLKPSPALA